jgi:hypothetical protein
MKYPAIFEPYARQHDGITAFFLNFNTIFSTIYPTAQQIADDDGDSDGELIGSCSPSSMPYNEGTCYPDEVPPNESYTPVYYEVDHSDFAFINPYDYDHDTLRGRREVEVQQIGYMQFRIQQDYICFTEGKYAD